MGVVHTAITISLALSCTLLSAGTTGVIGVVDTGTSLIAGPPAIVNPIIAQINASIDCSNLKSLPTLTITMGLNGTGTHDFPLTPEQYTVRSIS